MDATEFWPSSFGNHTLAGGAPPRTPGPLPTSVTPRTPCQQVWLPSYPCQRSSPPYLLPTSVTKSAGSCCVEALGAGALTTALGPGALAKKSHNAKGNHRNTQNVRQNTYSIDVTDW